MCASAVLPTVQHEQIPKRDRHSTQVAFIYLIPVHSILAPESRPRTSMAVKPAPEKRSFLRPTKVRHPTQDGAVKREQASDVEKCQTRLLKIEPDQNAPTTITHTNAQRDQDVHHGSAGRANAAPRYTTVSPNSFPLRLARWLARAHHVQPFPAVHAPAISPCHARRICASDRSVWLQSPFCSDPAWTFLPPARFCWD